MEVSNDFYEGLVGLITGLVLFISGIITSQKREKWLKGKHRAKATVFEIVQDAEDPENELYYPVIRFEIAGKEWISKRYHIGGPYAQYQEGQQVTAVYNKNAPAKFIIDNPRSKITGLLLTVIGAIVIVLSAALMVFYLMIS